MLVTSELYTRKVAVEVGSLLKYLIEHPNDPQSFEVEIVRYSRGHVAEEQTVYIRLSDEKEGRIVELANGREIIRCVTTEGKKIDFLFGHPDERAFEPAFVFYEEN